MVKRSETENQAGIGGVRERWAERKQWIMSIEPMDLDISTMELEKVDSASEYSIRVGGDGFLDRATNLLFVFDGYRRGEMDRDQVWFYTDYVDDPKGSGQRHPFGTVTVRQLSTSEEKIVYEISRAEFDRRCLPRPKDPTHPILQKMGGAEKFFRYNLEGWKRAATYWPYRPNVADFIVVD